MTPNQCTSAPNSCGLVAIGTNTCPSGYTCTDSSSLLVFGSSGGCTANSTCTYDTGTCSDPSFTTKSDCVANGDTWTPDKPDVAPTCDASPPSNASCPAPIINPDKGFYADPTLVTVGKNPDGTAQSGQTTLYWNTSNTTSCTIAGDNGFSYASTDQSGNAAATGLTQTTVFTLTCEDGAGGPTASKSIKVIVNPTYKEL